VISRLPAEKPGGRKPRHSKQEPRVNWGFLEASQLSRDSLNDSNT
jgi:hypothetical protein